MSKQDIEKRLGFAAQGVKETTRTSAKAEMGFLSRVGYAATALTADPADPKSAEYRKQVSEAKAAAKDAITNYKFMRDKVKERLAALDAYVTNAIKVINSATSAKDIEHYVEQLRIAVKSQSMILGASKSPFSRPGAKAKFGLRVPELETLYSSLGASGQAITDKPSARKDRALLLKLDAEYSQPTDTVMVALNAAKLYRQLSAGSKATPQGQKFQQRLEIAGGHRFSRPGVKAKA